MNAQELHERASHIAYHDHQLGRFLHDLIDAVALADDMEAITPSTASLEPVEQEPDPTPTKGGK